MNGYGYNPNDLAQVANKFRGAAQNMDSAENTAIVGVDAGASSGMANAALADLVRSMMVASTELDGVADKIHVAKGAYDDVESTNDGQIRRNMDTLGDYTQSNKGPL